MTGYIDKGLYQKLRIIPTWTDNTLNTPQVVTALGKARAPTLTIENYLVRIYRRASFANNLWSAHKKC